MAQASRRILVVDRRQDDLDRIIGVLESDGCIVSGTLSDAVAIDLAASSEFDAMVVGDALTHAEFASLREDVLRRRPQIRIVEARGAQSVLTLVRQAMK